MKKQVIYISLALLVLNSTYHLGKIARIHEEHAEFNKCESVELSDENKDVIKKVPFDVAYHYILGVRLECTFHNDR